MTCHSYIHEESEESNNRICFAISRNIDHVRLRLPLGLRIPSEGPTAKRQATEGAKVRFELRHYGAKARCEVVAMERILRSPLYVAQRLAAEVEPQVEQ